MNFSAWINLEKKSYVGFLETSLAGPNIEEIWFKSILSENKYGDYRAGKLLYHGL